MKNTMKAIGMIWFVGLVTLAPVLGQSRLQSSPSPAVIGPNYNLAVGYAYLVMPMPGGGHANFNGLDFNGTIGLSPRWAATLDSSYLYASDVLSTRHQGYVASLLSGPTFYPIAYKNTRVFVHALGGAGLVDGAVPIAKSEDFHGWELRPSYAFGGGVEHPVSSQLALRVIGDYLRTDFYDPAGAVQPQNNLRLTVSFVFRLKERAHRSSAQLR